MDFTYKFDKLKNGIEVFDIQDPSKIVSLLVVVIKRGSSHDPHAYGGTYHYMEHMLGSYFEYSKYGSNYDHLSMMNGSTLTNYLHIYKRFLFDESVLNSLVDNLCLFISSRDLNKNILENEKWMVNNETTSKLYDYPMMNIFFIYEQMQTGRQYSTFGKINSLSEQAVIELKKTLTGNDYCIFFVNIPKSSVMRQIRSLSKLKFEIPAMIDTLVRYKEKGSYSGKTENNPEALIATLLEDSHIPFEKGDLTELFQREKIAKRTMDFIIPNKNNPKIIIESSFLVTTSSGQGDKSKTEGAIKKLITKYYPKSKFIGFVDGIGWYVRKSDLMRMVSAYDDVFTFHKDEIERFQQFLKKNVR